MISAVSHLPGLRVTVAQPTDDFWSCGISWRYGPIEGIVRNASHPDIAVARACMAAMDYKPLAAPDRTVLRGTTYWCHPESDSYFVLNDGELDPRDDGTADGAMCVELTEADYAARAPKTIDLSDL